ncbi:ribosome-binding factor A [Elusimicrobiota bacterium]
MIPNRQERLSSLFTTEIAIILEKYQDTILHAADGHVMTITKVVVVKSLEFADVYYSLFKEGRNAMADEDYSKDIVERLNLTLKQIYPDISRYLSKRITMKRLPKLRFKYDQNPQSAERVYTIIENLKKDNF